MAMLEIKMHWWKWKINSNIYQRSNGIISQTITSNPAKNVKMIQTWNHFRRTGRSNDKMHIIQWSIETGRLRHTDKISVLWRSSLFVTSLYRYTPHACKTLPQKRNLYPLTRGIFWVLGEGEYRSMNLSLLAYQQLVDRKLSVLFCTLRMPAWISIFSKNHDIELQTLVLESFRNTMIAKNRKKIPV